jgi:hypothetical protein
MDFWYKFDDFFMFHKPPEISDALRVVDPYGSLLNLFFFYQRSHQIETGFQTDLESIKTSFKMLADNIIRILDESFEGNEVMEQNAFELFAQGLLFDDELDANGLPRRPTGDKIHMMDSGLIGFIVWHAFVRAVLVLDLADDENRWVRVDRNISLAAGILAAEIEAGQEPVQSEDPSQNKPLDLNLVTELRSIWLTLTPEQIDDKIVELENRFISDHNPNK